MSNNGQLELETEQVVVETVQSQGSSNDNDESQARSVQAQSQSSSEQVEGFAQGQERGQDHHGMAFFEHEVRQGSQSDQEDQSTNGLPPFEAQRSEANVGGQVRSFSSDNHESSSTNEEYMERSSKTNIQVDQATQAQTRAQSLTDDGVVNLLDQSYFEPRDGAIVYDDTSPLERKERRSSDPIVHAHLEARRQSHDTFQSPYPSMPPNIDRTGQASNSNQSFDQGIGHDQTIMVTGGGGGSKGDPSSSSSSTSSNSKPIKREPDVDGSVPSVCSLCQHKPHAPDCPRRLNTSDKVVQSTSSTSGFKMVRDKTSIYIDGRHYITRSRPIPVDTFNRGRTWDKFQRHLLSGEDKTLFKDKASGYVLSKTNKLKVVSRLNKDDNILDNVHNLQHQIKSLLDHAIDYDIATTLTIVIPKDLKHSPDIESVKYNLFQDYPKLTAQIVANSNAYYNRWVDHDFISEDMAYLHKLAKNNSDDTLFNKCLEEYEKFHPMQQGGPLIFMLLLHKLHNASEQYLDHLKNKVENLKISKLQGEDVDKAVSLLNAAYKTFESISTKSHNRIPVDWSKNLCKIFQTTSVSEFNKTFEEEERAVRRTSDKDGIQPIWPTHDQLTSQATATYDRLKQSGHWDVPRSSRAKAYAVERTVALQAQQDHRECWNCGSKSHLLPECPVKYDQARVDKARQKFRQMLNNKRVKQDYKPKFRKFNGKSMVLNKKGVYVLDQQLRKAQHTKRVDAALAAMGPMELSAPTSSQANSTPRQMETRSPQPNANSNPTQVVAVARVRDVLRNLL